MVCYSNLRHPDIKDLPKDKVDTKIYCRCI